jgi:glyoxylate carboligase
VDIDITVGDREAKAVGSGDWLTMDMDKLVARLPWALEDSFGWNDEDSEAEDKDRFDHSEGVLSPASLNVATRPLHGANGSVVGRLAIDVNSARGAVTVGGLRAVGLREIVGVLDGYATTASRQAAVPRVGAQELSLWATEQAGLVPDDLSADVKMDAANVIWRCGGSTGDLPIAQTSEGALNYEELVHWLEERDRAIFLQDAAHANDANTYGSGFSLFEHVVLISVVPATVLGNDFEGRSGTGRDMAAGKVDPGLRIS